MSRRSFCLALALVILLVGGVLFGLFLAVGYEPELYTRARPPTDPTQRADESNEFLAEFGRLRTNASGADRDWYVQFKDEVVNSYLEDGLIKEGLASRLPQGVSRPHVVFEKDKVHIAFRYSGAWNTIISIDLRVWLAHGEINVVALELEGLRAGALPISGQWLLEKLARGACNGINGLDVSARESSKSLDYSWYRADGHPVVLLRFQPDQAHPTLLLQDVHAEQGSLIIRGRSPDAAAHALLNDLPVALRQLID